MPIPFQIREPLVARRPALKVPPTRKGARIAKIGPGFSRRLQGPHLAGRLQCRTEALEPACKLLATQGQSRETSWGKRPAAFKPGSAMGVALKIATVNLWGINNCLARDLNGWRFNNTCGRFNRFSVAPCQSSGGLLSRGSCRHPHLHLGAEGQSATSLTLICRHCPLDNKNKQGINRFLLFA